MKEGVDPVSAICLDHAAVLAFGMLLNDVAVLAEERAGLDDFDGLFETLAGCFDDADRVGVGECFGADVVGFVEVAVVATVVEGYVDVDDVAVFEGALVGDAVTDDFVDGGADRFRKVNVV